MVGAKPKLGSWCDAARLTVDATTGCRALGLPREHLCSPATLWTSLSVLFLDKHVPARLDFALAAHMWRTGRLVLEEGDGRADSIGDGPYHAIHVGAAAESIPDNLTRCLAKPGRMVVPVGPEGGPQTLMVVDKSETGAITTKKAMGVIYVPLCDKAHQTGRRTFI